VGILLKQHPILISLVIYCGGINPKTHTQRAGVYWRLGYRERESTQGTKISGKKLDWMVRSKERREAYIHEVGHVDINYVDLKPPGGFPTTILHIYYNYLI
jgi:hypothetical protein